MPNYGIRSQADYISRYRRVLEHFDAVKIGLTATPAKHTAKIFGKPIYTYSYREAVIDGWLIDHEPPISIVTKLAESGIHLPKGKKVHWLQPTTKDGKTNQLVALAEVEDEVNVEVAAFNKAVLAKHFNEVVAEELARQIDPNLPGKTLVFAVTDFHADEVVQCLRDAFEKQYGAIDHDMVIKITGTADKPRQLIKKFRNEQAPKVVVTVDLLTTGIDIASICNLVFLRRVKSRILYSQMLGRATRRCDKIGKETFRIFDAVGLYEALEEVSDMRPVVTNPNATFAQLLRELRQAVAEVEDKKTKEFVLEAFIAKLQRKKQRMNDELLQSFEAAVNMSPNELAKHLRGLTPEEGLQYLEEHSAVIDVLERTVGPEAIPIAPDSDRVTGVEHGYGKNKKPKDYLDEFARFVTDNMNAIPALAVAAQRPRDLTRKQLRDLELALANKGYTTTNLKTAWADMTNADLVANVISFVRQAALGDPVRDYNERVDAAVKKLSSKHQLNKVQRDWLNRIGSQLKAETVVDRDAFDRGQFGARGGFDRLNIVFDGKLEALLGDLQDAIWQEDEAG